jgi:uncharacterized protein YciU (UPF0263 family)
MKSTLAILALSMTFATSTYASEAITLSIKTEETTTFKKTAKNLFEKVISSAKGTASLDYNNGKSIKNLLSQDVNETDDKNSVILEIKGKNLVRVVDVKEDIDTEIQADIDKTIFGNVKGLSITSDNMNALYAKAIKRSGVDVLKKLRIGGDNGTRLASDIVTSDFNCQADGELLNCKQNVSLTLSIKN